MSLLALFANEPVNAFTTPYTPNFYGVDYTPGTSNTANDYQTFNLYLPDASIHPKPSAGYPVVVRVNCTSFTASSKADEISSDAEATALVDAGLALCDATVTFTTAGGGVTGGGMFWDPTDANWATDDVPEKDVIWIVQKLRDMDTEFGINPNAIGLYGSTSFAASTLCLWVAMETDHADSGASTTQEQQSSVPNATCTEQAVTWWPALNQAKSQNHLRDEGTPSTVASTVGDASTAHQQQASPIYRARENGSPNVPCHIRSVSTPASSSNLGVDADLLPLVSSTLSAFGNAWMAYMLTEYLRVHVRGNVFHVQHSELSSSQSAERANVDMVVPDTGGAFHRMVVAYFRAALEAVQGAARWDLPIDWAFPSGVQRDGLVERGAAFHRRQTRTAASQHSLQAAARTWEIGADWLTDAQASTLDGYWTASDGSVQPIEFPLPDGIGTCLAYMNVDSLDKRLVEAGVWAYSMTIEEVA